MDILLGTLIIISLCCLAMSLSLLFYGKPFKGGCGNKPPGTSRCETCPKRDRRKPDPNDAEGESS
jgi:hypothetical protein